MPGESGAAAPEPRFMRGMSETARRRFLEQLDAKPAKDRAAFLSRAEKVFASRASFTPSDAAEECNRELPAADRWKVVLDGFAYYTCAHKTPHIDLA